MKRYIAAYDIGTSGMKLVLLSAMGEVAAVISGNYPLYTPAAGYAQQDPADYWRTACRITKKLLGNGAIRPEEVKGIVFATQWKGIIALDGDDCPVSPAILWLDRRAGKQAQKLNERLSTDVFGPNDYWPKLLWLKECAPAAYAKTRSVLEINSWMKFCATGKKYSDLTSSFVRSPFAQVQAWYDQILQAMDIPVSLFPPVIESHEMVGELRAEAAEQLGFCPGTPVFAGCGDIPAIARGTGCMHEHDAHIYLGSSGWLGVTARENCWPGSRVSGLDLQRNVYLRGIEGVGLSLQWFIRLLFAAEYEQMQDKIFDWLNDRIAELPTGAEGLLCIPSVYGENAPFSPQMRGALLHLESGHSRFHIYRAVLEGICALFRYHKENYESVSSERLQAVCVAGGGALNPLWMQMMADMIQMEVRVPHEARYVGASGAAGCAMQGLGMAKESIVQIEHIYVPSATESARYDGIYAQYRRVLQRQEA